VAYDVNDIIDKAVNIALKRKSIYENVKQQNKDIYSITITSKVLIKDVEKTIGLYKKLTIELKDVALEEIDFGTYDKISFLINEFNGKLYLYDMKDIKDFLKFSLNLEKDIHSLFLSIQGRLIKNKNDVNTKTYKVLSAMINNKAKLIGSIEKILRENT
jgi:hypothetical protein